MKENSSTSLDALYELLKEKKAMTVDDIALHFNVGSELVMNWARILEAGELATIESPRIGRPVIKIAGYSGEVEEEVKKKPQKKETEEEEERDKEKEEARKDLEHRNKLIKNRNQGKVAEARKMVTEARKRGYDNDFIRKMFAEKNWPDVLIEELLKK